MSVPANYVSRIDVAIGRDAALLSVSSPSGDIKDGRVETVEVMRLVMSHEALRSLAKELVAKLAALPPESADPRSVETRSYARPTDEDETSATHHPGPTSH